MKQYVECSVCGKRLYFGEKVLTKWGYVSIFCSPNCFANDFSIGCCETILTKDLANFKEVSIKTEPIKTEADIKKMETQKINDLLYVMRTNMTSITRYVRHKREEHPTLTEGQFLDRHLKYRDLADIAVKNILEYINGTIKNDLEG